MQTKNLELLFEEHKGLINSVIWKNHPLLSALRLEFEDIAQELSIIMIKAIRKFDPDRSASLAAHIRCSLQYEILNIKRRYKPHGITGVPKSSRLNFLYLDCTPSVEDTYELTSCDDANSLEFSYSGFQNHVQSACTRKHGFEKPSQTDRSIAKGGVGTFRNA